MRLLVTGAAGFTGTFLAEYLSHETGVKVTGLIRKASQKDHLPHTTGIIADLLDREHLTDTVNGVCPDAIIHLGGITRGDLGNLLQANVIGTKNILEAGFAANPYCRILVVSSSAVYGYPGEVPIPESTPLRPLSEYGISKMAQEAVALMHHTVNGSHVCIARPFNLAGPGQPESFICGKLVRQVADIGQQKKTALDLLETSSSRDLIDVRDVIRGYWALISHPDFSRSCSGRAFNLGSGNAHPVSAIIRKLEELTNQRYPVNLPPDILQPTIPSQRSDNSQITSLTGWRPEISLGETLRDMLKTARERPMG
jgi:GDP-4-dehydro-6-deoxy-D-mannose reductase